MENKFNDPGKDIRFHYKIWLSDKKNKGILGDGKWRMLKLIEEKGLFLKTDGPSVIVKTYPDKLHIILNNLLTNAFKYTGEGGSVVIKARVVHCPSFNSPGNPENAVEITVSDTGIGIAPGDISLVFEKFYQATKKEAHTKLPGIGPRTYANLSCRQLNFPPADFHFFCPDSPLPPGK